MSCHCGVSCKSSAEQWPFLNHFAGELWKFISDDLEDFLGSALGQPETHSGF